MTKPTAETETIQKDIHQQSTMIKSLLKIVFGRHRIWILNIHLLRKELIKSAYVTLEYFSWAMYRVLLLKAVVSPVTGTAIFSVGRIAVSWQQCNRIRHISPEIHSYVIDADLESNNSLYVSFPLFGVPMQNCKALPLTVLELFEVQVLVHTYTQCTIRN